MDSVLRYPIRGRKFSYSVEIADHVLSRKTDFQRIDIYDTECFGKLLTLDDHVQLASLDERAYHEALVHIPMLSLEEPKRALVVGGGDGGVLRELCRWKCLDRIDMIEIDGGVIEACRQFLPEVCEGAFEDPRVNVHIGDAFDYVEKAEVPYDFIVMDITDVYEGEDGALSESLFTEKFHSDTANALTRNGLLVSQADNHVFCPYSLAGLSTTLRRHFSEVGSYQAIIPSFGGFSAYCWAGKSRSVSQVWRPPPFATRYMNDITFRLAFMELGFADVGS